MNMLNKHIFKCMVLWLTIGNFGVSGMITESLETCTLAKDTPGDKYYSCKTVAKPEVESTTIRLRGTFDTNFGYDEACGATMDIEGSHNSIIYHLDFRINMKNNRNTLVQNALDNGRWMTQLNSDITNLEKTNDIIVEFSPEAYKVRFNGAPVPQQFPLDSGVLDTYSGIGIRIVGSCFKIELPWSFIEVAPELDVAPKKSVVKCKANKSCKIEFKVENYDKTTEMQICKWANGQTSLCKAARANANKIKFEVAKKFSSSDSGLYVAVVTHNGKVYQSDSTKVTA